MKHAMNDESLPPELIEFERLLHLPNNDPTGLAGYFNAGEVWVSRVPARLDVMGGIADYSGANVCEAVLGRGMLMALQPRRTGRCASAPCRRASAICRWRRGFRWIISPPATALAEYAQVRALCRANPLVSWAAYIGGSIFTLLKEESVRAALWIQHAAVERGADERGHRQFGGGGDRRVELSERLPGLAIWTRPAWRGWGRWPRTTSWARLAASWTRFRSRAAGAGPVDAHSVPARQDDGRGGDSAGHGLCGDQFDGAPFGGGQSLRGRAHRGVHGEENDQ